MKTDEGLINAFEGWVREQGKSENTVATYGGVLQKFSQWLKENQTEISNVTKEDVQAYMNFLDEQHRSASTIDKVFATIRVLAKFLEREDIVQNVKKKEKEKNIYQTIPEPLKNSERKTLLKEVKQDGNLRNTAIVYMLLNTGIKISELCNLDYSDIKIEDQDGIVKVRNNQGEQQRAIDLTKETVYHLQRYLNSLDVEAAEKLFVSKDNKGLSTRAVQYMLTNYGINPIKLRHTFCQDLIDREVDLAKVAQLAGHKDINMTRRYLKKSEHG